jgi:hypothetical protein
LGILAELGTFADDVLERRSGGHEGSAQGIELAIALVARHQPVVAVPHHEAVGHGLDRVVEHGRGPGAFCIRPFALVDGKQDRYRKGSEEQDGDEGRRHRLSRSWRQSARTTVLFALRTTRISP